MSEKQKVFFVIGAMCGGGAERVITILANASVACGNDTAIILTDQKVSEVIEYELDERIKLISISESVDIYKFKAKAVWYASRTLGKLSKLITGKESDLSLVLKFKSRNCSEFKALKKILKNNYKTTAIAFVNRPIFLTLLAAGKKANVIISERNNPEAFSSNNTTMAFIRKLYCKSNTMVFQTKEAKDWYKKNTKVNSVVIPNPVKDELPKRFEGERSKKIVNFCRISSQKNLFLLVDAFEEFCKLNSEYELYIYGEAIGNGAENYYEDLIAHIEGLKSKNNIHISGFIKDIHVVVREYAMFVSSSDFEGMSNSMLEAMAIGLPTICTDCPAGGARAVIRDHENGILVPVGNVNELCNAMNEVANDKQLAEKLSVNGSKIREELSVRNISERWIRLINGGNHDKS